MTTMHAIDATASSVAFLNAADRIGARLCRDAIWEGNRCNWLGDSMEVVMNQWMPVLRSFGPDLYSGTSGIALYLAQLNRVNPDRTFRETALGAIEQASRAVENLPAEIRVAYWSGAVGVAHAMMECDRTDAGIALLETTVAADPAEYMLDVVSGIAGVIPFLLVCYKRYRRQWMLDAAVRYGERLLKSAHPADAGCSWTTMPPMGGPAQKDLTGYSHGAAGVAVALLELAHVTSDKRFSQTADDGIRYEQHWFNAQQGNWPDFREAAGTGQPGAAPQLTYGASWCHGAPGIALARLRAWQLTKRPEYRQQAEIALNTTWRTVQVSAPGQESYCLCHGSAGNAECLLFGTEVLGSVGYRQAAEQVGLRGLEVYAKNDLPWPPGVMGGIETPNLMLGNAGTGWFYLHLASPETVPNPLITTVPV